MSLSKPETKKELIDWGFRRLGSPVTEVNVSWEQAEDLLEYALQYYSDYYPDGSDVTYYKYELTSNNFPGVISDIDIINGGSGYANGEFLEFEGDNDETANISVITDDSGKITGFNFNNRGSGFLNNPNVSISTVDGSNASLVAYNGGYVPLPDNIIGAVNIFDLDSSFQTNNLFNIRYQIVLNDLYSLTSVSMVPYYMAMRHLETLKDLLVGKIPIRYNRHQNKLYLDMNWNWAGGRYVIVEAQSVIDPEKVKDVYNDRFLKNYFAALLKRQYGTNLKKFTGVKLVGGVEFTGQQIYNEAVMEIQELERQLRDELSMPVPMLIG